MLLSNTPSGIYCPKGDFYIDPWGPADRAVITHGHSDHARWGSKSYLCTPVTAIIMRARISPEISITELPFGEIKHINGVKVSLHPAGHIPGSAQVRIEYKGEVALVSGDYKLSRDSLSEPFEQVRAHHFVTESTFGLPVFKWKSEEEIQKEILSWWSLNSERGVASVITGWSLGKAQRILSLVGDKGPIYTHGAVENMNEVCHSAGVKLAKTVRVTSDIPKSEFRKALIIAPPSVTGSSWIRRFTPFETAMASGWMMIRGMRRRRALDTGFVLSDHCDWEELNQAVDLTGAEKVWVTHGYSEAFARWLKEKGLDAETIETEFSDQMEEENPAEDEK